jgi:hypothetical protein
MSTHGTAGWLPHGRRLKPCSGYTMPPHAHYRTQHCCAMPALAAACPPLPRPPPAARTQKPIGGGPGSSGMPSRCHAPRLQPPQGSRAQGHRHAPRLQCSEAHRWWPRQWHAWVHGWRQRQRCHAPCLQPLPHLGPAVVHLRHVGGLDTVGVKHAAVHHLLRVRGAGQV